MNQTELKSNRFVVALVALLPAINLLADMGTVALNPVIGTIRGTLLVILLIITFRKVKYVHEIKIAFLVFIIYLIIISLFNSTDIARSLEGVLKIASTIGCFFLAYYYLTDYKSLKIFIATSFTAVLILNLNYILAQFFFIGLSVYTNDSFYIGNVLAGSSILISIVILLLIIIPEIKNIYFKFFIYINSILGIIFILIGLKRTAILALLAGFIFYFFFSREVKNLPKYAVIITLAIILLFTYLPTEFLSRYDFRLAKTEQYETEGRYIEFEVVMEELISKNSIGQNLIGVEFYNSQYYFPITYFGRYRVLHIDYMILLHGAGIIGLILYFILIYLFLKKGLRIRDKQLFSFPRIRKIRILYLTMIVVMLLISIGGGITAITLRSQIFLTIGLLYGYLDRWEKAQIES